MIHTSLIFDIKRYSINDGPGIRVTVFFKGCPLKCDWCHNPESQSGKKQKLYSFSKCIGCGACVGICPENALFMEDNGNIVTDNSLCTLCGKCAKVCPTKAIEMSGRKETVESIMKAIRKETVQMDTSGGGVTFSGGEPLQHPEMLKDLLKVCGEEGIHRAVDTSGFASTELMMEVACETDLFLYDLKLMNSEKHRQFTGVPNELILDNLQKLADEGKNIIIRVPLIEGVNTDEENFVQLTAFISGLPENARVVNLLPYHSIASVKYTKLGEVYDEGIMRAPDTERIEYLLNMLLNAGIKASVGG
ncbi:MAG: glycyl-radical enzyme activating protein [Bacteroidales bacterium]|nr:glycyl-radical enzyme activating protein [Bacteroidales bacterium]